MNWFYNMKIRAKLISSFIFIALVTGVMGVIASLEMNRMKINDTAIFNENVTALEPMNRISSDFHKVRINLTDYVYAAKDKEKYLSNINKLYDSIDKEIQDYEKTLAYDSSSSVSDKEKKEFENIKTDITNYKKEAEKIVSASKANKTDDAIVLMQGDIANYVTSFDNSTESIFQLNFDQARQKFNNNAATASKNTLLVIIISIASMILAVGFGIFISKIISQPIRKLEEAADKLAIGDVNVNIEANTKDEIGKLMNSFSKMIQTIKEQSKVAERIAVGDLSVNLQVRSENDILSKNLNSMIDNIKALVNDAGTLSQAAIEGKLSVRADITRHQGEYRKIVEGVNNTLNSIIEPLDEANEVLHRMAVNDLTTKMNGQYNGMLKNFAESINNVHTRLVSIQEVFVDMAKGNMELLRRYENIGKRSENDKILPSMIVAMTSIKDLIDEVRKLSKFAVNGELSARGNAEKFEGGYREIIEGMNNTIDSVVGPIKEASDVLQEMAKGDLTVIVGGDYKGEHAKIKDNLNFTINSFNDILNDINSAAQQVAAGSRQVSDGSQGLSQGSTEQASSIEELSSAITQISVQTKQNAINAGRANELSTSAKENAIQGNEDMREMLDAMAEINESSSNISKIIKVIDEIAFQTNILALNAAVEAARAGQHGKGFAVVAEEVRNLAERSANAAKETTVMIESSIRKVEVGTKMANETATALDKIVDGIEKVANLVADIATASNEQATGISQINKGIEQVSAVVQNNSSTAEESAAASEELTSQAQLLSEMVGKFKLKRNSNFSKRYELSNYKINASMGKKVINSKNYINSWGEEVAAAAKPIIDLSDSEFGKY